MSTCCKMISHKCGRHKNPHYAVKCLAPNRGHGWPKNPNPKVTFLKTEYTNTFSY